MYSFVHCRPPQPLLNLSATEKWIFTSLLRALFPEPSTVLTYIGHPKNLLEEWRVRGGKEEVKEGGVTSIGPS